MFLRKALREDMDEVRSLIEELRLDGTYIRRKQFFVARHFGGTLIGCARLKPLGWDFFELASVGVHPEFRHLRVGWNMVEALLHPPPLEKKETRLRGVWAVCEKKDYNFFAHHGFLPCLEWFWPRELDSKVQECGEKYGESDLLVIHYGDIPIH
jgi:N-acetylglutamate synthase-like GNAT family acetyltransferase